MHCLLMFGMNNIQFVSPDIWKCWRRVRGGWLSGCVCVCVCVRFGHRGFPSANASSGVMGHDESEPNQCALPLGFIPVLALSGLATAVDGQNQHHLAKAEEMLSTTHDVLNQPPVSQHVSFEDQLTHTHTQSYLISRKGHPGGSMWHKRNQLELVLMECAGVAGWKWWGEMIHQHIHTGVHTHRQSTWSVCY